jgi:predicted lipase
MAKITFSVEELTQILISNELLRGEILRPKVEGEKIHFVIKTNSFILPYIPASLGFIIFSDNLAIFELTIVSSYLNRAVSRLKQILQLKLPVYIKLEYPKIFVDVDKLLKEKNIKGIRVKDVSFKDGEFTITTCNN